MNSSTKRILTFFFLNVWNLRKKCLSLNFFEMNITLLCPQWSLLLMSFLLIISITHQHFFRDQHFQISKFSQINFLSQHQHESGNAYPTKNDSCQTNILNFLLKSKTKLRQPCFHDNYCFPTVNHFLLLNSTLLNQSWYCLSFWWNIWHEATSFDETYDVKKAKKK